LGRNNAISVYVCKIYTITVIKWTDV
jgi:hypothetical protein